MTFAIKLALVFYLMKSETSIYKLCNLIRQNEQTKSHQRIFAVSDDLWKIKCDSTREYSPQAHINVSANYCINIFWIQSQMGYQLSSWWTQDVFTHHSRFSLFSNFYPPSTFLVNHSSSTILLDSNFFHFSHSYTIIFLCDSS